MTAASLIIGLDGADLDVIQAMGERSLPTLHRLIKQGAYARLECVNPPATLPNWTSFLTGANPGIHGVFDFAMREGYRIRFTGGSARAVPTVFAELDRLGLQCACLSFPGTWPVEQLKHGVYISGWDAPVAFEADASYVWPRQLHSSIVRRFGPLRFDTADEFQADYAGWHQRLPEILLARIKQKTDLASWLLSQKPWDVFAVYFGESDTAAHHLWSLHDPHSPRRPRHGIEDSQGLSRVYQALDNAVAELEHRAGAAQGTEITIVSDHGSGGSSDKVFYLNRWLADAGWLTFKRSRRTGAAATWTKQAALRALSPKLRQQLFESARRRLPSWLESQARFGNINMHSTRVFSDELNYFPALHFNLVNREPCGQLKAQELPRLRQELEMALLALRDPWTGLPVIKAVHQREDLFCGPLLHRAPDLLIEFHLDNGYSYNLLPSASSGPTASPWRRLESDEYLGRKGRSLPGSHRDRGIFVAAGPRLSATGPLDVHVTEAMGQALRVLDRSVLSDGINLPTSSFPNPSSAKKRGQAQIAARLRSLGYID